ncbi:hypothetical protein ACOME3_002452 [Neoechinorhynchus agilis]
MANFNGSQKFELIKTMRKNSRLWTMRPRLSLPIPRKRVNSKPKILDNNETMVEMLSLFRTRSEPTNLNQDADKQYHKSRWRMLKTFCRGREPSEADLESSSSEDDGEDEQSSDESLSSSVESGNDLDEVAEVDRLTVEDSQPARETVSMDERVLAVSPAEPKKIIDDPSLFERLLSTPQIMRRIHPLSIARRFKNVTSERYRCKIGCNGIHCKYELESKWMKPHTAIPGLYSTWITDNIVAMARPSNVSISKFKLVEAMLMLVSVLKIGTYW